MIYPGGITRQRCFAIAGGFIAFYLRQGHRQFIDRQRVWDVIFIHDRKRLTPITLTAIARITQTVVDLPFADAALFYFIEDKLDSVFHFLSVEDAAVDHLADLIADLCIRVGRFVYHLDDGQAKFLRELTVAHIICRHRHDSTCTISCEDILGDIDRYFSISKRVHRIAARECTCDLLLLLALHIGTAFDIGDILVDLFLLCRCSE